jgi:hypothetical protein
MLVFFKTNKRGSLSIYNANDSTAALLFTYLINVISEEKKC